MTAISRIVQAVGQGELTPSEAARMAALIEAFRKIAESEEIERRLKALEDASEAPGSAR